jgi:hypothetical protein
LFRESSDAKQTSLFDMMQLMPVKLQERLLGSWAQTFRQEVLARIPEKVFAPLYSEVESRPNASLKVLVGGEILKAGFGWTDEELEEHLEFDLLTRHALGLDGVGEEAPTMRTFYNLRRRVREYAQATGENLYSQVFATITDQQLVKMEVKTGWQRMDSTQLMSNIARMNRLELVISVLQKGVAGLPEAAQKVWQQEQAGYLSQPASHICYRLRNKEVEGHLLAVGHLLLRLLKQLQANQAEPGLIAIVGRTFSDQYQIESESQVTLRAVADMNGNGLQSPADPEATYRQKNGQSYKGYVTNLSETCDPANPVQLITSVQTAANTTDDGDLLAATLDDLAARQVAIERATVDGGYNGPTSEAACRQHGVQLCPTTIRGGQVAADRFGWDAYQWVVDEAGQPRQVRCPHGQTVALQAGNNSGWFLARFDKQGCANCPFYTKQCRVVPRKRMSPTLLVPLRSIQVALLRQGISADNAAMRANVESTVHAFKHPFPGGKLPVRGLIRVHMMACGSALMVNLRRLHAFFHPTSPAEQADDTLITFILPALTHLKRTVAGFCSFLRPIDTRPLSTFTDGGNQALLAEGCR